MSRLISDSLDVEAGFPRSRGDEPTATVLSALEEMFSPLTRG